MALSLVLISLPENLKTLFSIELFLKKAITGSKLPKTHNLLLFFKLDSNCFLSKSSPQKISFVAIFHPLLLKRSSALRLRVEINGNFF